eukprot:gene10391-21670_t
MRVAFIHLDLGIGGAERLIVNFATIVKDLKHDVIIITSHHDQKHCFQETEHGGILSDNIEVVGDWLPRQIFGKFTALCAITRMLYLSLYLVFLQRNVDVVIVDGVSAPIPLLQLAGLKVFFYCHFPDKLLCYERVSLFKRMYRTVIDAIEDLSTEFTAETFKKSFLVLGKIYDPPVIYPSIDIPKDPLDKEPGDNINNNNNNDIISYTTGFKSVFISINRFERKKRVMLAIEAFSLLKKRLNDISNSSDNNNSDIPIQIPIPIKRETESSMTKTNNTTNTRIDSSINGNDMVLVVAGGYDKRVNENVEYLQELKCYVEVAGLSDSVIFRPNISSEEKEKLICSAT